jgi:hypothetical protein
MNLQLPIAAAVKLRRRGSAGSTAERALGVALIYPALSATVAL